MQVVPFDGDFSPMFKQEIMDDAEVAQHVNVFQLPGNPSGSWAALTQHVDLPSTAQAQPSPTEYCECDQEDESEDGDDESGDESDETDFDLGLSSPMEEGQLTDSPVSRYAQSASTAGGSQSMAQAQASAMGWENNANILPPGAPRPRPVVPAWMADPSHPANQAFEVMRNLVLPMVGGDMTRREPPRDPPAPPAAAQGRPFGSYGLRGGRGPAIYYGPVEVAQQLQAEPRMPMSYNRHPVPNQSFHSGVAAAPTSVTNPGVGPGGAPQAQYPPQPSLNNGYPSFSNAINNAQAYRRGHLMQVQTMNNPNIAAPVGWVAPGQSQGHVQPGPQVNGNVYPQQIPPNNFANQVPGQSQTVTRTQTSYSNGATQRVETRSMQVMGSGPMSLPPPAPGMHRRVTVQTTVTDYHPVQGGMPHPMQ